MDIMANLSNSSLVLGCACAVVGLLLLSPLLTLFIVVLGGVCHILFHNVPTVARIQCLISAKLWGDTNDHPPLYSSSLFDGADMPSPIPHYTAQDLVKNRKSVSEEIVSSTPQSSPKYGLGDSPLLPKSHHPSEGRQLSFSRIAPKPTRLLTQEELKSNADCSSSSKTRSQGGITKAVQTVAGPLLASSKYNSGFDTGMFVNVNSPGFTERLVRCANDNACYNWTSGNVETHQDRYNTVGLFPIVHLNSAPVPSLSPRNSLKAPRSSVRVRIAPPVYTEPSRQFNGLVSGAPVAIIPSMRETLRQEDMAKSVLESLQEASRKRIYSQCQDTMEDDPSKKRLKKGDSGFPNPNCDLYQYRHIFRAPSLPTNIGSNQHTDTLNLGKRGREENSPGSGDSKRHRQCSKPCSSRNEISSSLSSSQKLLQRLSGSKRKAEGDLSRPGTPQGKHFKDDRVQSHSIPNHISSVCTSSLAVNEAQRLCSGEGECSNSKHPVKDIQFGRSASGKDIKSNVSSHTIPSQDETSFNILKQMEVSPGSSDVSSKLFRKEVSSRPTHQHDKSKKGHAWAQEPPDADERCLLQQSGSSVLDRPERFQSLLSRMCKQGTNEGQLEGKSPLTTCTTTQLVVPVSKTSPGLLSQHLSPQVSIHSSYLAQGTVPPSSISDHVDSRGENEVLPSISLPSLGRDGLSCLSSPPPANDAVKSLSRTSKVTVAESASNHVDSSKLTVDQKSFELERLSPACIDPISKPKPQASEITVEISPPSNPTIMFQTHATVSESSETLQVKSSIPAEPPDPLVSVSDPRPVFGFKPPVVSTLYESPTINPLSTLKSGSAPLSDNVEQGHQPAGGSAHVILNPSDTAKSDSGTQIFSFSTGNSEKTNLKPLYSSDPVVSKHDTKSFSTSSSFGTTMSASAVLSGIGQMIAVNATPKLQLSAGTPNNVAPSLLTPGSSAYGSERIFRASTLPLSTSTTTFSFSSPSSKTVLSEAPKSTFSPGSFPVSCTGASSFSSPGTQVAFNSFSSSTNLPSTSTPGFLAGALQQQTSPGMYTFGSSSNQTQTNFLTSPQSVNPTFGASQPQGLISSASSSERTAFGSGTSTLSASATFSSVNNISFGTSQAPVSNAFTTQSASTLGIFGTSPPFGSTSAPSSSQNFSLSASPSFSIPTSIGYGSTPANTGGPFQFGMSSDKSNTTGTFNFGANNPTFNFGNSSSQAPNLNQPFQFGQNSAAASSYQFGAPASQPPGGAPVFSIGAGPSSSHRSRPTREARRRR